VAEYKPWLIEDIRDMLFLRHQGILNAKQVREVFDQCWEGLDVWTVISQNDFLTEQSDDVLDQAVVKALAENPKVVADFKKGKQQAIGSLIGPIVRQFGGKADAKAVKAKLEEKAMKM
jgi:aspartyl-tRNA(Asn)/glutamyl-tRNA(Gln) amidotransferase subunit B